MAVLNRFTLMASPMPKGIVAAGMSMLAMACFALGIEVMRLAYIAWGLNGFTLALVALSCCYIALCRPRIKHEMQLRAAQASHN